VIAVDSRVRAATRGDSLAGMDDAEVISRIGALVDEEHALEGQVRQHGPESDAAGRLREVEVALDQCWDLLRQRRARREMGQDPDDARVRPPEVVERYQQ
jgi:DNA-binding Lrp family transcriptional regulator